MKKTRIEIIHVIVFAATNCAQENDRDMAPFHLTGISMIGNIKSLREHNAVAASSPNAHCNLQMFLPRRDAKANNKGLIGFFGGPSQMYSTSPLVPEEK